MTYSTNRLHGLDAARGGALLLGVVFHAAMSFIPGDQVWLVVDDNRSAAVTSTAYVLHIFRMSIFFLLAGFFGRMQLHRLGTLGFVKDRSQRIAAPLAIFWILMMVLFTALAVWMLVKANGGTMPENPPEPPPLTLQTLPLTHLWFLYALLLLYASALVLRALFGLIGIKDGISRFLDKAVGALGRIGLLPFILALPVAAAFISQPYWHPFFGIPAPETGLVPNPIAIVAYGIAFSLGWLIQRDSKHLLDVTKHWPLYLAAAVGVTAYCLTAIGSEVRYVQPLPKYATIAYPIAYAVGIWFWTFGLIGLCLKIFAKESKVRRYLADSSYWLYVIHLPLVMALQIWISDWDWPAELKFGFVLAVSIPIMLASYHLLVRRTFIGWLLNGKIHNRKKTELEEVDQ